MTPLTLLSFELWNGPAMNQRRAYWGFFESNPSTETYLERAESGRQQSHDDCGGSSEVSSKTLRESSKHFESHLVHPTSFGIPKVREPFTYFTSTTTSKRFIYAPNEIKPP